MLIRVVEHIVTDSALNVIALTTSKADGNGLQSTALCGCRVAGDGGKASWCGRYCPHRRRIHGGVHVAVALCIRSRHITYRFCPYSGRLFAPRGPLGSVLCCSGVDCCHGPLFETSVLGPLAIQAVPISFMFIPLPPAAGIVILVVLVLLVILLLLWMQSGRARARTPTGWAVVLNLGLFVALISFAGWMCWWWGDFVSSNPEKVSTSGPIALYFVLPATEGFVTLPSGEERCLLRVSNRVFAGDDQVIVGPESLIFRPMRCLS